MGVVAIYGFESGSTLEMGGGTVVGTASVQSTVKRSGTYAARCNPTTTGTGYFRLLAQTAALNAFGYNTALATYFNCATITIRFYMRIATLPSSGSETILYANDINDLNEKLELRVNSTGTISIYNSTGTTLVATGATALSTGTWYRIELQAAGSTSAAYELRINGVTELSGTGANFRAGNWGYVFLGKVFNRNSQSVDYYFDDVCIRDDSTWPGEGQGVLLPVDGPGSSTAWTGTYTDVDEVPNDGDTTVITSSTTGQVETVTFQDTGTAGINGTINGVLVAALAKTSSSRQMALRTISGGTTNNTSDTAHTTSYLQRMRLFPTDPNTSAAWALSAVDAVEAGVIVGAAGSGSLSCTNLWVYIDYAPSTARPRAFVVWT